MVCKTVNVQLQGQMVNIILRYKHIVMFPFKSYIFAAPKNKHFILYTWNTQRPINIRIFIHIRLVLKNHWIYTSIPVYNFMV